MHAQFNAKLLEGDVEYMETDEEEKGIKFAQLVADRQIAFSAQPSLPWCLPLTCCACTPPSAAQLLPHMCLPGMPCHDMSPVVR